MDKKRFFGKVRGEEDDVMFLRAVPQLNGS